jgi:hypothetical protein
MSVSQELPITRGVPKGEDTIPGSLLAALALQYTAGRRWKATSSWMEIRANQTCPPSGAFEMGRVGA